MEMASGIFKMYAPNSRKAMTHISLNSFFLEMSEFHNYKLGLAKSDFSTRCQKQRCPVIKSKCRENGKSYVPFVYSQYIQMNLGNYVIKSMTIIQFTLSSSGKQEYPHEL